MNFYNADHAYWMDGNRQEAEEKGSAFVNAFRRLDIDFDDIEIREPCDGCRRADYKITLGAISADEAGEFAWKVNQAMDLLDGYRRRASDERLPD